MPYHVVLLCGRLKKELRHVKSKKQRRFGLGGRVSWHSSWGVRPGLEERRERQRKDMEEKRKKQEGPPLFFEQMTSQKCRSVPTRASMC